MKNTRVLEVYLSNLNHNSLPYTLKESIMPKLSHINYSLLIMSILLGIAIIGLLC